ncbi:archaellin/type IV pilin N-terminal domain-containing protein [Natranaeroarchaeum aerophilus]|uniref:Flagellin n=1 Tax=Natranaeroarchaeum aerophilus TaxID=2917711 RepID=A0AAE3FS87_9EURY|nr:archaellin/type IV pilin N-terminal domain-containing protein [Natranaeroarchaeum aerophilus]MCL9814637.1 hypothetical protein [Natranaeroarchaeum aerophilus]
MEISIPEFTRDNDRGQVGIETLIVFIAMILVAAIAASVLINTAGFLQNQASETSQDSEDQVSNQVLIISSIGEVTEFDEVFEDDVSVTLEQINSDDQTAAEYVLSVESDEVTDGETLDVTLGDGFDDQGTGDEVEEIDVGESENLGSVADPSSNDVSVTVTDLDTTNSVDFDVESDLADEGDEAENTLSVEYTEADNRIGEVSMTVMQSPGANEIDLAGASIEYIGPDGQQLLSYSDDPVVGEFGVDGTQDPDETAPVLTQREDRYTVTVDLAEDEDALRLLEEGEDATVRINTQAGSEAVTILNVPQSISSFDDGDAVEL